MAFHNKRSKNAEEEAAIMLGKYLDGRVHPYGDYNAIDWWVEKGGQMWAVAEFKNRRVKHDQYPTLYISLRKWTMLQLAALSGVRPLFVVNFTDGLYMLDLHSAPVSKLFVHRRRTQRARNDTEPMLEVPVDMMEKIDNA